MTQASFVTIMSSYYDIFVVPLPLPKQNPPSPPFKELHVLFINIRVASLDPGAQLLHALLNRSSNAQRYFIRKDVEYGKYEECQLGEIASAEDAVLDVFQEPLGLAECILSVIRRCLRLLVVCSTEELANERDKGRA